MSSYNSPSTATPSFDNLLAHSLMGLHLDPSRPTTTLPSSQHQPILSKDFQDFLSDNLNLSSDNEAEDDDNLDFLEQTSPKTQLSLEESRLEKEIIKIILSGKTDPLKPNSGHAVSIGEHYICVGFHEEDDGSGYRVWEWHGHIMLFDEDTGYTPEYVYGNYFERVLKKRENVKEEKKEEKVENLGLRELIDKNSGSGLGSGNGAGCRVLHSGWNAGSPKVLDDSSEK